MYSTDRKCGKYCHWHQMRILFCTMQSRRRCALLMTSQAFAVCVWRAGAAAAAGGALVAAPLRLVARISNSSLKRSPNEHIRICGLCALADDVLVAACESDGLRALRLSSAQLCARDPSALKDVCSAALDAASGTLLLALVAESEARAGYVVWLVSLQCVADEWREMQRLQTECTFSFSYVWVGLSFAGDSRVLCGQRNEDRLYAFDVNAERRLRPVGAVVLDEKLERFACTRLGGDSLVAIADAGRTCVSIQRLVGAGDALRLEPLARTALAGAENVLFRGDQLLVATDSKSVVSFGVSGGGLKGTRELLGAGAGVGVYCWCLAGDRLVAAEWGSYDLVLYEWAAPE